jgi:hypothetical protein
MDKDVKLATGDKALLETAATGKGMVELTPAVLDSISQGLKSRTADIEARYPKLVEECQYETRLAVTAWVFDHLCKHAEEGGTFRYLIYDRLGFGPDAYVPLYMAGGMTISNEFDLSKPTSDSGT